MLRNLDGFWINTEPRSTFRGTLSAAGGTFAGDLSAVGGTFTGTVEAAAIVAAETFTAATANFSGNAWVDGDVRLTEGGSVFFYNTTGGLNRHGAITGASNDLTVEADDTLLLTTLGGDIVLDPTLGVVDFAYAADATARTDTGTYLGIKVDGVIQYLKLYS